METKPAVEVKPVTENSTLGDSKLRILAGNLPENLISGGGIGLSGQPSIPPSE